MEEKKVSAGESIIKQGEKVDYFFVVDSGEFDCSKVESKGKKPIHLKTYYRGEGFGELALLYNTPRAATIKANKNSVVFQLDRATFNYVVTDSMMKKRKRYEKIISNIKLLESLNSYEKNNLIDALQKVEYKKGSYVIRQGEEGTNFYFVESGKLVVEKKDKNGEIHDVMHLKQGDYFGEIALLKEVPRQASVKALEHSELMKVDKDSFERVLGPLKDILSRDMNKYGEFVTGEKPKESQSSNKKESSGSQEESDDEDGSSEGSGENDDEESSEEEEQSESN